jgi:hypothetical protein
MKQLVALWIPIWLCPFIVAQERAKLEVFGGYSLEHISTCGSDDASCSSSSDGPASTSNFNGWDASLTGYFYKFLGATADFSGHRGTSVQVGFPTSVTRYSFMFGPVATAHLKTISPFAHILFGGTSNNYNGAFGDSYTAFTWAAGGGLDVNVSRRFAVRLGQFDYERVRTPGSSGLPAVNGFRYSCGVVFKF